MRRSFYYSKKCSKNIIVLFRIFFLVSQVESTVFGLINNMERLVEAQKSIVEYINPYIIDVPQRERSPIEKYIDRNLRENSLAMKNISLFLANPINCYILVKRLTRDLNYVENVLEWYTDYKKNQSLLHTLPNEKEFNAAADIIVLLVYVYDIEIKDFANGNFTRAYSTLMTSSDCYEVAYAALEYNEYNIAIEWFFEASRKYHEDCQYDCPFTNSDIVQHIKHINQSLMERSEAISKDRDIMTDDKSNNSNPHSTLQFLRAWDYQKRYLCHKEHIHRHRLQCQYRYGPHPFLRLARFKEELLHLEPEITMMHDVISDKEIEFVKYTSEFQMNSSKTCESHQYPLALTLRHAVLVPDRASRVAAVISRRSLDISGMTGAMAQSIKVLNYGAAGYHRPHIDSIGQVDVTKISAQATVVYSLSEPDLGGATVFDHIGLSVFPVKNSALYWKTLSPSGQLDFKTRHASCPILHGAKWVLIKWLSPQEELYKYKNLSVTQRPLILRWLSYKTLRHLDPII